MTSPRLSSAIIHLLILALLLLPFPACSEKKLEPEIKVEATPESLVGIIKYLEFLDYPGLTDQQKIRCLAASVNYEAGKATDKAGRVEDEIQNYQRYWDEIREIVGESSHFILKQVNEKSIGNEVARRLDKDGNAERPFQSGSRSMGPLGFFIDLVLQSLPVDKEKRTEVVKLTASQQIINSLRNLEAEFDSMLNLADKDEFKPRWKDAVQLQIERVTKHAETIDSFFISNS